MTQADKAFIAFRCTEEEKKKLVSIALSLGEGENMSAAIRWLIEQSPEMPGQWRPVQKEPGQEKPARAQPHSPGWQHLHVCFTRILAHYRRHLCGTDCRGAD